MGGKMYDLFDYINDIENEDCKKDEQERVVNYSSHKECIDKTVEENEGEYLKHLEKVKSELYNEEEIEKSGLSRSDYIRLNSYVGSRMNTDFRKCSKMEKAGFLDIKKEEYVDKNLNCENNFEEKISSNLITESDIKNRLLIVDGSSLLSTSFYATARDLLFAKTDEQKEFAYTKLMQTKDGIYTNGIYMFFKTLLPLIADNKITHLAVVMDRSRQTTFRRELYSEYKANRKETPLPLKNQFKLLTEILSKVNIPVFSHEYYEADDFAGTICKKFENNIETILYSKDEDYIQLVSDNTKLWMVTSKSDDMYKELGLNRGDLNVPYGVFEYNPEYVKHFKGIEPIQIIDAKAIEGDKSDNIKGVKNVGETSSRPLIRYYGSLEGIYNAIEGLDSKQEKDMSKFFKEELGIKRSPIKNMLLYKEDAFLSKKLATIKTDIEDVQNLELDSLKLNIDKEEMNKTFEELEMKSLIK